MLQYLSAAAFSPFGRLLDPGETVLEQTLRLEQGVPGAYLQSREPVGLGPGEGMVMLQILRPSGAPVQFYLDKPVQLLPEHPFAVLPVEDQCSVRWTGTGPLLPVDDAVPLFDPVLMPSVDLERLYTFFDQSQQPGFFFAGERHRPYELVFVRHGLLHNLVGGQDYVLHANEALVIPPDQWHVQYGAVEEAVQFVTVTFSCRQPLPEALCLRVLPEQMAAADQMRSLLRSLREPGPYGSDLLLSGVQLILVHYACALPQGKEGPRPVSLRNENQILDHALEYAASHTHERITVAQLAKHCSVSTAYLSLLFQRHLHISPGAYLLRARLAESCLLLQSGAGTMAQIAESLCFSSPQHFSTAFKRQYGMSPLAYVKTIDNGQWTMDNGGIR